jgi:hypothetical protein
MEGEKCENYQDISFTCAAYILYAKIISRRIDVISTPLLNEEQNETVLENEEGLVCTAYLRNSSWNDMQDTVT